MSHPSLCIKELVAVTAVQDEDKVRSMEGRRKKQGRSVKQRKK